LVGDTEVDYQTALAAGMQIAVVTWGFRSRAVLESAGCEPLFDTVEELETEVFPWQ
jgi:phosphoglycolate phosphatase